MHAERSVLELRRNALRPPRFIQRRRRGFSPSHRGSLDGTPNLAEKPADSLRHTSDSIDDASDGRRNNEFEPVKSRADHPQLPDKETHQDRVDHREDNVEYEEVVAGSIHDLAPFRLHAVRPTAFAPIFPSDRVLHAWGGAWQVDVKYGAVGSQPGKFNSAAVGQHDLLHDRETKSGAVRLGSLEEAKCLDRVRHAGASVRHRDAYRVCCRGNMNADPARPAVDRFDGVFHQVVEHAAQLFVVRRE
jgi:hypothetical protein